MQHVRDLAKEYGARITWEQRWHLSSSDDRNNLVIPKPYNARLYMVCLHELGHIADPLARKLWDATERTHNLHRSRDYLACEAAATGWAIDHIDPQLSDLMPPPDVAMDYLTRGIRTHIEEVARARRAALLR